MIKFFYLFPIDALREAGARVTISSTIRFEQRQYLMHWSWRIGKEGYWFETTRPCGDCWFPPSVPCYSGNKTDGDVEIIWLWRSGSKVPIVLRNCQISSHNHTFDATDALNAAKAMADCYCLRYRPGEKSRHTEGRAIDMTIEWDGDLEIEKRNGTAVRITSTPRTGQNRDLHTIGATYGVHKLVADKPHWSEDGR